MRVLCPNCGGDICHPLDDMWCFDQRSSKSMASSSDHTTNKGGKKALSREDNYRSGRSVRALHHKRTRSLQWARHSEWPIKHIVPHSDTAKSRKCLKVNSFKSIALCLTQSLKTTWKLLYTCIYIGISHNPYQLPCGHIPPKACWITWNFYSQ